MRVKCLLLTFINLLRYYIYVVSLDVIVNSGCHHYSFLSHLTHDYIDYKGLLYNSYICNETKLYMPTENNILSTLTNKPMSSNNES